MQCLKDWLLLEEEAETGGSGIIIPDNVKEKQDARAKGYIVLQVGKGWWEHGVFMTTPVRKGDLVLLDSPMVARFNYKGVKYIACAGKDVAFIVKRGKEVKDEA